MSPVISVGKSPFALFSLQENSAVCARGKHNTKRLTHLCATARGSNSNSNLEEINKLDNKKHSWIK